VMIARLFPRDYHGFYIDVGAADPESLSVTCHFYNNGWNGINIDPVEHFYNKLQQARPRDINLNVAIGDKAGSSEFFEISEFNENSSLCPRVRDELLSNNLNVNVKTVEVITLEKVCDRYAHGKQIDFLKIDVEGTEISVIISGNWIKYRPILLIIEAVEVNSAKLNDNIWENLILSYDYVKVWFDGLNNFYLRKESLELRRFFICPPNVFDRYKTANSLALEKHCADRLELINRLTATCEERLKLIQILDQACKERLSVIDQLAKKLMELR
jgi:FkbM family methyltransferase